MLMFVSFNQVYGALMSLLSGAILTSAISSFFLGIAMLAFAVLILVSCPFFFLREWRTLGRRTLRALEAHADHLLYGSFSFSLARSLSPRATQVCCFMWFFFVGRFLGFMFYLNGRGIAYFLLGLLSVTDPRMVSWLNIVQFLLCWFLIVFGIVYFICGLIPGVMHAYRPILLGANGSRVAVRHTTTYYTNSSAGQRG